MGLLRSMDMGYYNLIIPGSAAWSVLNELGKISALQFYDQNPDVNVFNRTYAENIRICEDTERRIKSIELEMEKFSVPLFKQENSKTMFNFLDNDLERKRVSPATYFAKISDRIRAAEGNLKTQIKNYEEVQSQLNALEETKIILEQIRNFVLPEQAQEGYGQFYKLAGILDKRDQQRFWRMVYRATRGNGIVMFDDLEYPLRDSKTGEFVDKVVFRLLLIGEKQGPLSAKLNRICDSFGARKMPVNDNEYEMNQRYNQVQQEIEESKNVASITSDEIRRQLEKLARQGSSKASKIEQMKMFVLKDKAIYHALNMFTERGGFFYGSCWCALEQEDDVRQALEVLQSGELHRSTVLPENQKIPTCFRMNEFTQPFQDIVDTYGVPNYKEANPALFTCATFPFLFGIMFGDIGHGLVLLSFAVYLCLSYESIAKNNGLFKPLLPARYLLVMMGICSTYCGSIYNDFFGIPLDLFGTKWVRPDGYEYGNGNSPQYTSQGTYPYGIDPIWYKADNELVFLNSFKMKVAVIFGVTQMIMGNLIKGANAIYFRKPLDFLFEFVPQIVFMLGIFGYMIIMVFIKWSKDWGYNWDNTAPNLITVLMNMFLKLGSLDDQNALWGDKEGQESLQLVLLLLAVLMVPLMLLPKPLILRSQHQRQQHNPQNSMQENIQGSYANFEDDDILIINPKHKFDFGEEFIHQMIETIEYVLGAISNTASYLRLWALSLAHSQLSKVFLEKCIISTVETENPALVVVGFFLFANVTLGVLMCMDSLECFLHALRLHWVEFQNKFYGGDGAKFNPFDFNKVFLSAE